MLVALREFAPHVEHNRWRVDLAQLARIQGRLRRYNRCAEIADALQFRWKIDQRIPIQYLIDDFASDPFDRAQRIALRR